MNGSTAGVVRHVLRRLPHPDLHHERHAQRRRGYVRGGPLAAPLAPATLPVRGLPFHTAVDGRGVADRLRRYLSGDGALPDVRREERPRVRPHPERKLPRHAATLRPRRPAHALRLRGQRRVHAPGALQSRNKKLVTLDLGHPDGLDLAKKLAAESDVLLENFRPGTLEKLGLGWDVLKEINPRLILVRVSGYGQTGPYKDKPGFANIGEVMGGIRYLTGETGRPPVRTGVSLGDSLASLYAVIGTLMAVHARDVRGAGEGRVVDVALYEAVFNLMKSLVPEYDIAGIVRERTGASLPGIAPSNSYCAGDGSYVAIGANSDAIFKRLIEGHRTSRARRRPPLRLQRGSRRARRRAGRPDRGLDRSARGGGDPAHPRRGGGPCRADLLRHRHPERRAVPGPRDDPRGRGRRRGEGEDAGPGPQALRDPRTDRMVRRRLGAHNEEVYGGLLGLSHEEIEHLSEEGAI